MLLRCSKESQHPAEWVLGLRLSSPREQERHNVTVITVGSKYYSLCSVSSSLSHANLEQPFRTLTNKVRGKYIYKEVFLRSLSLRLRLSLRLLFIASVCIQHIYVCILHEHVYVYISIFIMWVYNRTSKGRTSSSNLRTTALCRYWM